MFAAMLSYYFCKELYGTLDIEFCDQFCCLEFFSLCMNKQSISCIFFKSCNQCLIFGTYCLFILCCDKTIRCLQLFNATYVTEEVKFSRLVTFVCTVMDTRVSLLHTFDIRVFRILHIVSEVTNKLFPEWNLQWRVSSAQ